MKILTFLARSAVAGFTLASLALAGGGPNPPGGNEIENLVPGEDITSLPIVGTDVGGFSFTGTAFELRELLGAAHLRGAARVENLGDGRFTVLLAGDALLVLERERLVRTNVRIGFQPGRLFQGDAARLVLNQGVPIDFHAEDIGLPVLRMAGADSVQGVGITLRVLGREGESFRGGVVFGVERVAFAQRVALGG